MAKEYTGEVVVSSAPKEYTGEVVTPKAPVSEAPGFGEKAGAFVYGLATGIPGSVGDIEAMLPGGPEVGAKGKGALKGYETVFPTTQNIQSGLTKLGVPEPRKEVSGYKTAGELAPAVVAGGKGLYELGKYGVGKLSGLFGGGKELAEALKTTTAGRVSEEAAKAGKRAETAQSRAGAAQKIAEREAGKPAAAYGELPGVVKTTEAGVAKSIPQSMDEIGSTIRNTVEGVYGRFKATRAANAEKNKGDAFNFARQKELGGAKPEDTQAYKEVIQEIDRLLKDKETGLAVATLDPIKNPLLAIRRALDPRYVDEATGAVMGKPVNFEGLEQLRRFLRDRSYGIPSEGFDAINQQRAGKLADSVERVMSEFSNGKIDKFISQYRKDSEPLRVFQTRVGKALVDEQLVGKGINYASVPAQSIPGKVFRSKEEFGALIDSLGGNEKLAKELGQKYFAAQLEGIKDAKGVENFIRSGNNRTMLTKTGSLQDAEKYAISLRDAEKRGARATEMGKTRAATAAEQKKLQNEFSVIESDLNRATTLAEIDTQVTRVANTLEKNGLISVGQRDQILSDAKRMVNAQQKADYIKKWMKYGIAAVVGSGAAEAYRISGR
jgi:hypothetical protein